jgi:hypothetical protein
LEARQGEQSVQLYVVWNCERVKKLKVKKLFGERIQVNSTLTTTNASVSEEWV